MKKSSSVLSCLFVTLTVASTACIAAPDKIYQAHTADGSVELNNLTPDSSSEAAVVVESALTPTGTSCDRRKSAKCANTETIDASTDVAPVRAEEPARADSTATAEKDTKDTKEAKDGGFGSSVFSGSGSFGGGFSPYSGSSASGSGNFSGGANTAPTVQSGAPIYGNATGDVTGNTASAAGATGPQVTSDTTSAASNAGSVASNNTTSSASNASPTGANNTTSSSSNTGQASNVGTSGTGVTPPSGGSGNPSSPPSSSTLASSLQRYRDLMIQEATAATPPKNPAVIRRYLAVTKSTYVP